MILAGLIVDLCQQRPRAEPKRRIFDIFSALNPLKVRHQLDIGRRQREISTPDQVARRFYQFLVLSHVAQSTRLDYFVNQLGDS